MPEARRVQSQTVLMWVICALAMTAFAVLPLRALAEPAGADAAHPAIRESALPAAVLWCVGWPIALATPRAAPSRAERLRVRVLWTAGCVLLLLHIAVAFHLGHGWSHEAAREHTRQVGGYGDGIFVNYAFALVWLADVVWAWASFRSYVARPRWLNWAIHGFLAFVVVNAAVVFGGERARFLFVVFFLASALGVWLKRRREQAESDTTTDIDRL